MSKISIPSTKMFKLRKYKPRMEAFKDRIEQAFKTLSELYITQNVNSKSNKMTEKITKNNLNKKIDFKDSSLNKNMKIKKYKLLDKGTSTQEKNENKSNSNEKKEDKLLDQGTSTQEKNENESNSNEKIEDIEDKKTNEDNKDDKVENDEDGNIKVYSDKIDNSENSSSLNENNSKKNKKKVENKENEQTEGNENNKEKNKDSSEEINDTQDDKTNITNGEENDNDNNNNSNNNQKDIVKVNESEKNIETIDKKDKSEVKINSITNIKKNNKIINNNYEELKGNEKETILPFVHKIKDIINKLNEIKINSNISEDDINDEISLLPDRSLIELSMIKFKLTKKYEAIKELYDNQSKELSKLIEENISQRNIIEEYKKAELENNNKIDNLNNEIKILKTKLSNCYQEIENYQKQLKKNNNINSPKISLDQTIKNILNKKDFSLNDTLKKKFNNINYSLNVNLENILNNKEKSLKRTNSDFVKLKEENKIENGICDYRNKKAIYSPLNKMNINLNNNDLQSTSKEYFSNINTSRQRNKYSRFNNSSLDYDILNIASGYKRFEIKNSVNLNNLNSLLINSSRKLTPLKIKNTNIVYNNGEKN